MLVSLFLLMIMMRLDALHLPASDANMVADQGMRYHGCVRVLGIDGNTKHPDVSV